MTTPINRNVSLTRFVQHDFDNLPGKNNPTVGNQFTEARSAEKLGTDDKSDIKSKKIKIGKTRLKSVAKKMLKRLKSVGSFFKTHLWNSKHVLGKSGPSGSSLGFISTDPFAAQEINPLIKPARVNPNNAVEKEFDQFAKERAQAEIGFDELARDRAAEAGFDELARDRAAEAGFDTLANDRAAEAKAKHNLNVSAQKLSNPTRHPSALVRDVTGTDRNSKYNQAIEAGFDELAKDRAAEAGFDELARDRAAEASFDTLANDRAAEAKAKHNLNVSAQKLSNPTRHPSALIRDVMGTDRNSNGEEIIESTRL